MCAEPKQNDWSDHSEHLAQVIEDPTAVFCKLVFQFRQTAAAHCVYVQGEFFVVLQIVRVPSCRVTQRRLTRAVEELHIQ